MPSSSLEERLHLADAGSVLDVDVRDLVIGQREGARGPGVQHLATELEPHRDQPRLP